MRKQHILLASILSGLQILCLSISARELDCSAEQSIEIKASGFFGFGTAAKREQVIGRLSKTTSLESTYERSFEIGPFRFVRENEDWSIYRKDQNENYILRKDIKYPVKVLTDQPIYVSRRDNRTLEIRRNTDDTHSTHMQIQFSSQEIVARNADREKILSYKLCGTPETPRRKSAPPKGGTPSAPVGSGR